MEIKAAMVKELRALTGAGMMECKKALVEAGGDMEAAEVILRKKSKSIADKKASRVAAEGRIAMAIGDGQIAMIELNSETDFVANKDEFCEFAQLLADRALQLGTNDHNELLQSEYEGQTFEDRRRDLVGKIGENISLRRVAYMQSDNNLGHYLHGTRIGVMVECRGGEVDLAKDISMHVAASNPLCVNAKQIPEEVLNKEREIYTAQAQDSGKPPEIIQKMVDGRINKFIGQATLEGQPYIKDPDISVAKLLSGKSAEVLQFVRFGVGEGIEKKEDNFASEVMSQITKGQDDDQKKG